MSEVSAHEMKKDFRKRWKRFDRLGSSTITIKRCGKSSSDVSGVASTSSLSQIDSSHSKVGCGYQCRMAVNPGINDIITSNAEIEGRVRRKNDNIVLDLALSPKKNQNTNSCSKKLCCFSKFKLKKGSEQEKCNLMQKMNDFESELNAVAQRIRCQAKKIIQNKMEDEEKLRAAALRGKFQDRTKSIHKTFKNEKGEPEEITITVKEHMQGQGKNKTRVITTVEDHKTKHGCYRYITKEKVSKRKNNKFKVHKTESLIGNEPSVAEDIKICDHKYQTEKRPKGTHKDTQIEKTIDVDGKIHQVKTEKIETHKGRCNKIKTTVEDKGCLDGIIYEKTKSISSEVLPKK